VSNLSDDIHEGNRTEELSLIDHECLAADFIPLPRVACHEIGAATQTLGAVLRVCGIGNSNRTFACIRIIADCAMLPARTVKRHIETCIDAKWLASKGRERLGRSTYRRRRTVTLELTAKAIEKRKPFGVLPRWAAHHLRRAWAQRAVYAAIVARHLLCEAVTLSGIGEAYDRDEMSLANLMKETALSNRSVIDAKGWLQQEGLIVVESSQGWPSVPDKLTLNSEFMLSANYLPIPPLASEKVAPSETVSATERCEKVAHTPCEDLAHTPCKSGTGPVKKWHGGSEKMALLSMENCYQDLPIENSLSKSGQIKNSTAAADAAVPGTDHENSFSGGWEKAKLESIARRGVKPFGKDQRETLRLVCRLGANGKLAECFIDSAAEAVRAARDAGTLRKPVPYFMTVLRDETRQIGLDVDKLLQQTSRETSPDVSCVNGPPKIIEWDSHPR
jgi:hypothetical protein